MSKLTRSEFMTVKVHLSGYLTPFSGGITEVMLNGDLPTVGDALESLWKQHGALRDRVLNETGEIRQHVNIFAGSVDVKRLKGLQTGLREDDIYIFNAVSGG